MPVIVTFSTRGGQLDEVSQTLGPYRTVQLERDVLYAFDGFQPFRLAYRTEGGFWVVNGLEGMAFDSVQVMPPPDQAEAELDAISDDDEED